MMKLPQQMNISNLFTNTRRVFNINPAYTAPNILHIKHTCTLWKHCSLSSTQQTHIFTVLAYCVSVRVTPRECLRGMNQLPSGLSDFQLMYKKTLSRDRNCVRERERELVLKCWDVVPLRDCNYKYLAFTGDNVLRSMKELSSCHIHKFNFSCALTHFKVAAEKCTEISGHMPSEGLRCSLQKHV